MNEALVRLVRKYEDRAALVAKQSVVTVKRRKKTVETKPQASAEFYRNAARQVLALAMQ